MYVSYNSKLRCSHCKEEKEYTLGTMVHHLRTCNAAVLASGQADKKTVDEVVEKQVAAKKSSRKKYQSSEKYKTNIRIARFRANFIKKHPHPDRLDDRLTMFDIDKWDWHPFYHNTMTFMDEDISTDAIIAYRKIIMEVAKPFNSILDKRGMMKYQQALTVDKVISKVKPELVEEVKILAEYYFNRLAAFSKCVFASDKNPQDYVYIDFFQRKKKIGYEVLQFKIFKCGK